MSIESKEKRQLSVDDVAQMHYSESQEVVPMENKIKEMFDSFVGQLSVEIRQQIVNELQAAVLTQASTKSKKSVSNGSNKTVNKDGTPRKKRKPLTEEQKAILRKNLAKARAQKKANIEAEKKKQAAKEKAKAAKKKEKAKAKKKKK